MRPVVEPSGALVSVLDPDGRIQHFDAGCALLTGHPEDAVMGRFFWDVLPCPPADATLLQSAIGHCVIAKTTTAMETLCVRAGSDSAAISWRFSPLTDTENKTHVVATGFDVSGKKKAEESQCRLAAIVESSADAIIMESQGAIVSWNAAAERIFGYLSAEVLGRPLQMLIPEEDCPEYCLRSRRRPVPVRPFVRFVVESYARTAHNPSSISRSFLCGIR